MLGTLLNGIKAHPVTTVVVVLLIVAAVLTGLHWFFLLHWLAVHTGSETAVSGKPYYNFWSGFGSDLGEVTIITAILGMYYKHVCHEGHCWRIAKHIVAGTPWCTKHHKLARQKLEEEGVLRGR